MTRTFAFLAMAVALALPGSADAIIGGQPDGNGHPNVALLWITDGPDRYICTGTLVSPTVVVTAAHCLGGVPEIQPDKVEVTFDPVLSVNETTLQFNNPS